MPKKNSGTASRAGGGTLVRRMTWLILLLVLLSPLGLLARGGTWGEWDASKLRKIVGYTPRGMAKFESIRRWAPMAGYRVQGWQGELMRAMAYMASAAIGIVAVVAIFKGAEFLMKAFGGDSPGRDGEGR